MKLILTLFIIGFSFSVWANEEQDFLSDNTRAVERNRTQLIELSKYVQNDEIINQMKEKKKVTALSNDEREILREAWGKLLHHHLELNVIINSVNKKIKENEKDQILKNDYFIIQYAAYVAQYRSAIDFIRAMRKVPTTDYVLNEPLKELDLEANSFAQFKFEYLNVQKFAEYSAYRMQAMNRNIEGSPLKDGIDNDNDLIESFNHYKGFLYTMKNAGKVTRNVLFKMYFPIQKNISEWMGDERVARGEEFLINQEQVKEVYKKLKAGDVMIERREWYLSNIGLPGFWPHAALYIGQPEDRAELEENEDVREWVREKGEASGSFEALLKQNYGEVYAESLETDTSKHPYRVLEAMSEGVVFTSIEHSANADSLAVLRPRLSKLDIAKGIFTAFKYKGRPYDFNFDFRTDSEVVCSELVFYTYQPTKEKNGLYFPVTNTLGRPVVTPNNIIKNFAETYGTEKQQYDFILFLDGNDRKREAVYSTPEELNKTWHRPKWFIYTQNIKK